MEKPCCLLEVLGGFGIDRDTFMVIQKSCPKSLKLIEDCKRKNSVQKKNYKFILKEGVLFAQFNKNFLNICCIVLPPYIALLVLRHFHVEKKLHISPKQLGSLFGQTFYTFNLGKLCQEISEGCLHCVSHFFRNRRHRALGQERLLIMFSPQT